MRKHRHPLVGILIRVVDSASGRIGLARSARSRRRGKIHAQSHKKLILLILMVATLAAIGGTVTWKVDHDAQVVAQAAAAEEAANREAERIAAEKATQEAADDAERLSRSMSVSNIESSIEEMANEHVGKGLFDGPVQNGDACCQGRVHETVVHLVVVMCDQIPHPPDRDPIDVGVLGFEARRQLLDQRGHLDQDVSSVVPQHTPRRALFEVSIETEPDGVASRCSCSFHGQKHDVDKGFLPANRAAVAEADRVTAARRNQSPIPVAPTHLRISARRRMCESGTALRVSETGEARTLEPRRTTNRERAVRFRHHIEEDLMLPTQRTRRAAVVAVLTLGTLVGAPAIASAHPDTFPHSHVWNDPNNTCPAGQNEWNLSVFGFQFYQLCTN